MKLIPIARSEDVDGEHVKLIRYGEYAAIALCRVEGVARAVGAHCPHSEVYLAPGKLRPDGNLECPLHGGSFSLLTGKDSGGIHQRSLDVIAVIEHDGLILLQRDALQSIHRAEPNPRTDLTRNKGVWL